MAKVTGSSGGLTLELEEAEASILRGLLAEMRELLDGGDAGDPVMGRLFPDAYEDEAAARAYRDMVGAELKNEKLAALEAVERALGAETGPAHAHVEEETIERWLRALTEMRLALGTRLGVDEETMSAELKPGEPVAPAMAILHWLGWLQHSMLEAMEGDHE